MFKYLHKYREKLHNLHGERGGRSSKAYIGIQGKGGLGGTKKDYVIF